MSHRIHTELVEIYDVRTPKDMSSISFSGFKKTDVKNTLVTSMYESKIEESCYWSAELVCAGHFVDVWDIMIYFFARYIHVNNPKLAIYIDHRLDIFKTIINSWSKHELHLRNVPQVRELIADIIIVMCESPKSHKYSIVCSITTDDFNLSVHTSRFKAPSTNFAQICMPDDPDELMIATNELSYSLSEMDFDSSCYWVEWLMEYDATCKKNKQPCVCAQRAEAPVNPKFQTDIVWIIWDILVHNSDSFSSTIQTIVRAAVHMYALKYASSAAFFKKRRFVIYFAIDMMTSQLVLRERVIQDTSAHGCILSNISCIYDQIKTNECN